MNIDKKRLYAIAVFFPCTSLLALLVSNTTAKNYLLVVLVCFFAIAAYWWILKRSSHALTSREVGFLMFLTSVTVLMLYYLSGLHYGFYQVAQTSMTFRRYILPYTLAIIASEVFRSILLQQKKISIIIFSYLSMVLFDVLLFGESNIHSSYGAFLDFTAMVLFPAITGNVLYHYVSWKFGMIPNVIYRLIMTLYVYVLGILPQTPDSMVAFAKLMLPLILFLFIRVLYERKANAISKKNTILQALLSAVLLLCMTLTIMLISCQFRYGLLVVGSESMTGAINKGDAIIYDTYDHQIIQDEQIVVFKQNDTTYIHRIVHLEQIDGEIRYYTKGDANDGLDSGYITNENLVGIVTHKIKYIGYPTIWIRELFH